MNESHRIPNSKCPDCGSEPLYKTSKGIANIIECGERECDYERPARPVLDAPVSNDAKVWH